MTTRNPDILKEIRMRRKLLVRALFVVSLVVGLVASSAAPAAAVATHLDFVVDASGNPSTMTIGSGFFSMNLTIPNSGPAQACDVVGAHSFLTPDIDASGNVSLAAADYKYAVGTTVTSTLAPATWNISGTDYQVVVAGHHATTGTISGATATIDVDVSVVVRPCAGGTQMCTINHVAATLTGAFAGSLPPASGDAITALSGTSSPLLAADFPVGCNSVIRAALLGKTATFVFHLVNDLSSLPH